MQVNTAPTNNNNQINNNPNTWDKIKDCSPRARKKLANLSDEEKVQIAVQRIIEGQWIYFTCGHPHSQSPFKIELRDRVVCELQKRKYNLVITEDFDDGSSIYASRMNINSSKTKGLLAGVYVYLKAVELGLSGGQ